MTTYIADWVKGDRCVTVHFQETSWRRAENYARRNGWMLIGEYIETVDCPSDIAAMIEKQVRKPTLH